MSRSGYNDYEDDGDGSQWRQIMWRGTVASAVRGKRGQAFLREMVDALDAMPEKRLVHHVLEGECGVCAIGSVGVRRGLDMTALDPDDPGPIADAFGIAPPLVREIEWKNDQCGGRDETPEARWKRMRSWAESAIAKPPA